MSKISLNQFSFNRGEVDPALHGRSDWKYYYAGAEKLENLITRAQGAAVKRGGLRLVAPALDDDKPSILVPFRFSVKQSYMLELGDRKMRIIKDGGIVVYPAGHAKAGEEVVVETPYPGEALSQLRHAQTADVMIFTHAEYPAKRLARHDHHDWRFTNLINTGRTPTPENLRVAVSGGTMIRYVVTAVTQDDGESPPSETVTAYHPDGLQPPDFGLSFSELYAWLRDRDPGYLPAETNFFAMTSAEMLALLRACGYQDYGAGLSSDQTGTRWQHRKPNAETGTLWWVDGNYQNHYHLYQECLHACDEGWAGNVKPALVAAIEKYLRDYNAHLAGNGVSELVWDAVAGAESYRVYRDSSGSGDGTFHYLGESGTPSFVDENLEEALLSLPVETDKFVGLDNYPAVCAFFEQRLVLARTNSQPTTFWGSDTGVYNSFTTNTPIEDGDSYEFTLASGDMNEIHWIVPLNEMLLGSSGGEWKAGGGGSAITAHNINARVQSWYGCAPLAPVVVGRTVIFAGRSRRTIRNFSYSLEADGYAGRDLTAYASHLFAGRVIAGMCYQQEPSGILWVVMSDGALLSCTYAPEEDVVAWSRHSTAGAFEACGSLVDTDGTDQVYFLVARRLGGRTRRYIETLEDAADRVESESEGFFLDCGLTYRGSPVNSVSGLDHLEGETVTCLADGSVFPDLRVENGTVTLPGGFTAAVIHAGLPYWTELVTLELEPEDKDSIRNRSRFAVAATVRLHRSRECLYSHSGGTLSEMRFRTTELPGRPARLFTGEKNITFTSTPGARTTRLRFVSESPVPLTILGVIAEASYGQPA